MSEWENTEMPCPKCKLTGHVSYRIVTSIEEWIYDHRHSSNPRDIFFG